MSTYRLKIPGRLPGMNDIINANRRSRYQGNSLKQDVQLQIMWYILSQLRNVKISCPVALTFYWVEQNRKRDLDNIASGKKFIQDALVRAGVLQNDGWKNIKQLHDFFGVDKENPHILVMIEELEDDQSNCVNGSADR